MKNHDDCSSEMNDANERDEIQTLFSYLFSIQWIPLTDGSGSVPEPGLQVHSLLQVLLAAAVNSGAIPPGVAAGRRPIKRVDGWVLR